MRSLRYIGTVLMLLIAFLQGANAREESDTDYKEQQVDVNEIVFGHIGDSYEWHITDIGDTPIAIPLPVIVKSSTGWHVFLSSRFEEGNGEYEGRISERWPCDHLYGYKKQGMMTLEEAQHQVDCWIKKYGG